MSKQTEEQLAEAMALVLIGRKDTPAIKRLKLRIRDLGRNVRDEVRQFRQLQKACRKDAELAAALAAVGAADLPDRNTVTPSEETGKIIQAFNRMLETHWENY